ncbi:hypothetical protein CVT91_00245 [Candidatus Atribacteria bacterium HGW-Atribacteria-1]|nr:MAG: hypothetical protein CVT91_00245 [Candidatus Atribacteria bacterium HGW-Atribacteria-1]
MNKVLFTTPILEHPAAGGPQLRIENSIKALSRIAELHIVSRKSIDLIGGAKAQKFYEKYCVKFLYAPTAIRFSINRYLRKLQKIWRSLFNFDDKFIINYCEQNDIDIIWFGYGNISFDLIRKIKTKRPDIKVICDTDSVWSRFILRELPYEEDAHRRLKIEKDGKAKQKEELLSVNLCEVTTAVSEVDAQYYRSLSKDPERIKVFSNVIDIEEYHKKPPLPENLKRPAIYLAGTFWKKSPMEKGARWVIEKVLPIIKKSIPEIHFYIIGRNSDTVLTDINASNISITGKLDSVLPYLCNADVAIVPLKFESGTRFKILEAGACSIPVVSTTLGAEGIPVSHEKDILIADNPNSFATAIIKLIKDKEFALKLGKNLHELIANEFSVKSLENEAKNILR